jgi:hypothetical protein
MQLLIDEGEEMSGRALVSGPHGVKQLGDLSAILVHGLFSLQGVGLASGLAEFPGNGSRLDAARESIYMARRAAWPLFCREHAFASGSFFLELWDGSDWTGALGTVCYDRPVTGILQVFSFLRL